MAVNKALEQELLRAKLRPADYLARLTEIDEILATHWQTIQKNQIDALKAAAEINHKMLSKSLPDLKAIEIAPEREAPVKFIFQTTHDAAPTKLSVQDVKDRFFSDDEQEEQPVFTFR